MRQAGPLRPPSPRWLLAGLVGLAALALLAGPAHAVPPPEAAARPPASLLASSAGGSTPDRSSFGAGFGGFLALERELWPRLVLRREGGPLTQVFQKTDTAGGAPGATHLETPLTFWVAGGLCGRF